MSQAVSHAADVAPGLGWHEFRRTSAETVCGFADPLQATLDGVARLSVPLKRPPIDPSR